MTTLQQIQQFFVTTRGVAPSSLPAPTDSLFESGLLDSLAMIEFVEYLQTVFGIELDEDDVTLENFESLATVTTLIDQKVGAES